MNEMILTLVLNFMFFSFIYYNIYKERKNKKNKEKIKIPTFPFNDAELREFWYCDFKTSQILIDANQKIRFRLKNNEDKTFWRGVEQFCQRYKILYNYGVDLCCGKPTNVLEDKLFCYNYIELYFDDYKTPFPIWKIPQIVYWFMIDFDEYIEKRSILEIWEDFEKNIDN